MGVWGGSPSSQQNIPTDTTVMSLFDTAYVHPILQKSSLIWNYYDFFVKRIFQLISGTMHGHDQWAGGISDDRYHISRSKRLMSIFDTH
jgi:dimethylaniline monooxygenase (N-oxide forming)